jgi:peptidoglycan hydrolase-like protein with peptidoglycan-binding domain
MRYVNRFIATTFTVIVLVVSTSEPAAGDHAPPFDGRNHLFGEMVAYPLVFPVVGDYWHRDWFWARRGSGVHHGQDIFADKMTPVVAVADGTILRVNGSSDPAQPNPERCCTIVLLHDDGWQSFYIHLNNDTPGTDDGLGWGIAPGILPGTRVEAGDHIGWVGDSGNAEDTPPHLHFELRDPDGVIVNPYQALRAAEGHLACTFGRLGDVSPLVEASGLLRVGSQGTAVRVLQRALDRLGHAPGLVDGIFGPLTDAAVRSFQQSRTIAVDGIVGSQTKVQISLLRRLADGASLLGGDGRILDVTARGWDVRGLQTMLAAAGHGPGTADGVFGPITANAVRSFQAAAGIEVDGIVGPATRSALVRHLGLEALSRCR